MSQGQHEISSGPSSQNSKPKFIVELGPWRLLSAPSASHGGLEMLLCLMQRVLRVRRLSRRPPVRESPSLLWSRSRCRREFMTGHGWRPSEAKTAVIYVQGDSLQQVPNRGWVDFDLDAPFVMCCLYPFCLALVSPNRIRQGRQRNCQNHYQPNPGARPAQSPCSVGQTTTRTGRYSGKKFCQLFPESSPCLPGHQGSYSTAVELPENNLQNILPK